MVAQEPVFDYTQRPFQSRPDRFAAAVNVAKRMMELKRQHKLSEDEFDDMRDSVGEILPCVSPAHADLVPNPPRPLTPLPFPAALHTLRTLIHEGVFMPALLTQASDEQLARYRTLAENMGILGAYAQTELGHVRPGAMPRHTTVQRGPDRARYIPRAGTAGTRGPTSVPSRRRRRTSRRTTASTCTRRRSRRPSGGSAAWSVRLTFRARRSQFTDALTRRGAVVASAMR